MLSEWRSLDISSPMGILDWFFYGLGVRPEFPLGRAIFFALAFGLIFCKARAWSSSVGKTEARW